MNKWHMTVGYPGGEYAAQDPDRLIGLLREDKEYRGLTFWHDENAELQLVEHGLSQCVGVRPCPPDLVEWIERITPAGNPAKEDYDYKRVPGGWLRDTYHEWPGENGGLGGVSVASTFIPVQGAAGLTVLEAVNE